MCSTNRNQWKAIIDHKYPLQANVIVLSAVNSVQQWNIWKIYKYKEHLFRVQFVKTYETLQC